MAPHFASRELPRKSGYWYLNPTCVATTMEPVNNRLGLFPYDVEVPETIDRLGCRLEAPCTEAGAVIRLGIYANDGTNFPGSLLVAAPPIDASVIEDEFAVVSQHLMVGRYWLACVAQAPTSTSGLVMVSTEDANRNDSSLGVLDGAVHGVSAYKSDNSVTGALPATISSTVRHGGTFPLVTTKIA